MKARHRLVSVFQDNVLEIMTSNMTLSFIEAEEGGLVKGDEFTSIKQAS